jgi:antitoxin component of MazEF toxin-antitoxin module
MSDAFTKSTKVAQRGNSAAVRLPAAALDAARLRINDAVEVIAREDEIIIRRQRPRVTMAELLARFDPTKHRHDLQLDAEPIGTETPTETR